MFKGARQTIRSQFKQIADEVQADKEQNWTQMMSLETIICRAIEEQGKLSRSLDLIIEEIKLMEKSKQEISEKDNSCGIITFALMSILVVIIGIAAYQSYNY